MYSFVVLGTLLTDDPVAWSVASGSPAHGLVVPIGNILPAEAEERCYAVPESPATAA